MCFVKDISCKNKTKIYLCLKTKNTAENYFSNEIECIFDKPLTAYVFV